MTKEEALQILWQHRDCMRDCEYCIHKGKCILCLAYDELIKVVLDEQCV